MKDKTNIKDTLYNFRSRKDKMDQVVAMCKSKNIGMSKLIRLLLDEWLAKQGSI